MNFRFAEEKDANALRKIYNQYINTTVTFEYVLPTEEEFQRRIREICTTYPYIVCEENGTIVGYAYAHRVMERAAFEWGAELSIYLDHTATGHGLGKKLYQMLIEMLQLQGVQTVYALVTSPNPRSEIFHQDLGFELVGTYHKTGYKCGRWCDLFFYEKQIGSYELEPVHILPIHEVTKDKIKAIFDKWQ